MKPIRLEIQAFGAFAGRQDLDFADLKGRPLFLISGPTGSGKTTVLDAICFALYGTTSGDERDGRGMRSDHVGRDIQTVVTFDFELGGKTYRVKRNLAYERPARRGGGTTEEPQGAQIWERTGMTDPAVDGRLLQSQWDKVTRKVENLLGFRDDEFRQVVVLPQGRFRDLLLASSDEREKILATLFRTRHYAAIERALAGRFSETRRALEARESERKGVLAAEGVGSDAELAARAGQIDAELAAASQNANAARAARKTAVEALEAGRRCRGLLDEVEKAEKAWAALHAAGPEMDALRIRAERGRAAAILRDAAEELRRRDVEARDRESEFQKAAEAVVTAEARLAEAGREVERQQALDPEREGLAQRALWLEQLAPLVASLSEAAAAAEAAKRKADAAAKAAETKALRVDTCREAVETARSALDGCREQAGNKEAASLAKQQTATALRLKLELEAARIEATKAGRAFDKARKRAAELATRHGQAEVERNRAHAALHEGAAGLLAARLVAGQPCPVCGSRDHPAPASRSDALPDPARMRAMDEAVRMASEQARAAEAEAAELQALVSGHEARVRQLVDALGNRADLPRERFEDEDGEARARLDAAAAAERSLAGLQARFEQAEADLARAVAEAESRSREATEAAAAYKIAEATLREREQNVPEELRASSALHRERQAVAARLDAMKRESDAAKAAFDQAREALASSRERSELARKAAEVARKTAGDLREAFLSRLAEAGFDSEGAFADALRTDAELAALDARIQEYDQALASAADRRSRARQAAEGIEAPDLPALEAAAQEAAGRQEEAERRVGLLQEQARRVAASLQRLRKDEEATACLARQHGILGALSNAANGVNQYRITFQRYVLAAMLDSVLAAATVRLREMTAGRYLLRRTDRVADRRSGAGLDMEVMDHYTGVARPVASLSGGESFLAALALALGLADVVQAFSGGVHLDTVFIDEGFGSLDPDALEQALKVLTALHESGRLVGIISHVPELKRRLDARLEVVPGRGGSTARFVVG